MENQNTKNNIDETVSQLKNKFGKGMEKVESIKEKTKINKVLSDLQNEKAKKFAQMGQMLHQKIRMNEFYDSEFDTICEEILQIDKKIHENNIEIDTIYKKDKERVCECGYILNQNDKFCAECGSKIPEEEEEAYIVCNYCSEKIDTDSIYCVCCGNKQY